MSNPILKKELYLLKGSILAGIGLMVLIWIKHAWIPPYIIPSSFWALGVMALLLSHITTSAFGNEISGRFLGSWILQPHTRKKLWLQKLTPTLTVYFALSLVLSFELILAEAGRPKFYKNTDLLSLLPCLLTGCLGPGIYYNLKFRNPVAALWLTVTVTPILFVFTQWCGALILPINWQTNEGVFTGLQIWIWGFFLIYGVWGFVAAYRLFLRWEDLGSDGKALDIRFRKHKNKPLSEKSIPNLKPSPIQKYILNELHIQQFNILIGLLMVGGIWGTHYWATHRSITVHPSNDTQELIAMLPSMFRYMLFILPCSIAALAIADNRRQDVITWELMLPLSRHMKWVVKFAICLLLSWIFTTGLTWTYDNKILFSSVQPESKTIIFYVLSIAAIVIGSLSFYISSLTSSFLKSFSFSLGLLPLMAFFLGFIHLLNQEEQGGRFPIGYFAVPTGIILVLSLCALWWSRTNFSAPLIFQQHRNLNWKRWGLSFLIIVFGIGIMVDRSWERITLNEAPPSKTIAKGSVNSIDEWQEKHFFKTFIKRELSRHSFTVTPFLGDMRGSQSIAITSLGQPYVIPSALIAGEWWRSNLNEVSSPKAINIDTPAVIVDHGVNHRFLLDIHGKIWIAEHAIQQTEDIKFRSFSPAGTRYRALQCSMGVIAAIDESDRIWIAENPVKDNKYTGLISEFELIQPNHTWKDIWAHGRSILGLKHDGSLWVVRGRFSSLTLMNGFEDWNGRMTRIAKDLKWNSMKRKQNYVLLEAGDGTLWADYQHFRFSYKGTLNEKRTNKYPFIQLDIPNLQHLETSVSHPNGEGYYFIKNDGTLWRGTGVFENLVPSPDETKVTDIFSIKNAKQIGKRNDWVCLYMYAGMTADGKIWNWDQPQTNRWNPFPARFRHKVVAEVEP